jgi:hypothetical protein
MNEGMNSVQKYLTSARHFMEKGNRKMISKKYAHCF